MSLDYNTADRLLPMKTVQRDTITRADALRGSSKDSSEEEDDDKQETKTPKENVVLEQMAENKAKREHDVVMSKVHEAVSAARESCQNRIEGVHSKKARRAIVTETLNDLIAVIEQLRDDPKSLIAAKGESDEASVLLP